MAVKGGHGVHGNGSRGRSYGLILMLAFGAAIFGVMLLHKLRERRIYNLLVQEKDQQLISLQLLLQKEKDNTKDAKRQIEEMKAKMYKLRTKKLDLETRILEMESTISSLREEQRTIASTLEEKQSQIKTLMDRNRGENQESARVTNLSEALRKKEAEIEELKNRVVELPVKVWSVSSDDPSNLPINLTAKAAGESVGKLTDANTGSNENFNSKSGETSAQNEVFSHKQEDPQQVKSNTSIGNEIVKLGKHYSSEIVGRRTRGKRRRISIMNRGDSEISAKIETEGVDSMRSRKSYTESMESERDNKITEDDKERKNESTLEDPKAELPNKIDAETVKSYMDATTAANEKSPSNLQTKSDRADNGEYDKSLSNLQNMPANSTLVEDSGLLNKTENHKSEENGQPEVTTATRESKDEEDHEASRITERDLKEDDLEVDDDQETEPEALTSRNSISDAEEDDEPEF